MSRSDITPDPTPEEVAAIAAAVEALWPRPAVAAGDQGEPPTRWRFSGRWWLSGSSPVPTQRRRP
jgi:hypothetical protein